MFSILAKIKQFVNDNFSNLILFIIVILLVMLAFALGYICAKYQTRLPITINN